MHSFKPSPTVFTHNNPKKQTIKSFKTSPSIKWLHKTLGDDVEQLSLLYLTTLLLMHQYQVQQVQPETHLRPAKPDPPLNLSAPKPKYINAKQNSTFGFKSNSQAPSNIDSEDVDMADGPEIVQKAQENHDGDYAFTVTYGFFHSNICYR